MRPLVLEIPVARHRCASDRVFERFRAVVREHPAAAVGDPKVGANVPIPSKTNPRLAGTVRREDVGLEFDEAADVGDTNRVQAKSGEPLLTGRGGVMARASWRDAMRINLHSRLTQRVLLLLPAKDQLSALAKRAIPLLSNPTVREFPDFGSGVMQQHADVIARELRAFFDH